MPPQPIITTLAFFDRVPFIRVQYAKIPFEDLLGCTGLHVVGLEDKGIRDLIDP